MNSHSRLGEKSAFLSESAWKKVKNVALSNGMTMSSLLSNLVEMSDLYSLAKSISPTFNDENPNEFLISVNGYFQRRRVVNGVIEIWSKVDQAWYTFDGLPYGLKREYGYVGKADVYPLALKT